MVTERKGLSLPSAECVTESGNAPGPAEEKTPQCQSSRTGRERVGYILDRELKRKSGFHDPLTGLPNRSLFVNRLQHVVERTNRESELTYAVLDISIDRFKTINEALGYMGGSLLLATIARMLESCVRKADTVARLDGDRFAILLEGVKDSGCALRVAERITECFASALDLEDRKVFVTASIGIAIGSKCGQEGLGLMTQADTAVKHARALSNGRTRYQIFDAEKHVRAIADLQLETELRQAVEGQAFRLHYQPILSLSTGKITGFEALIRWQHPRLGNIPPIKFIPIAEETGLIVPIGAWVLRESCRKLRELQDRFPRTPSLSMSVNISAKQIVQSDFLKDVENVLAETGLAAECVKLEITETSVMEDPEAAERLFSQLKTLGVCLHMDDFGTGYSSLSYLHRFPIDVLKVDRSFVSNMEIGKGNREIVQAIVVLAHALGLKVVAEGIETSEQKDQLKTLGCEYGQGYFFSKPVDAAATEVLLADDTQALHLRPANLSTPVSTGPLHERVGTQCVSAA